MLRLLPCLLAAGTLAFAQDARAHTALVHTNSSGTFYIEASQVDLDHLLAPPPALGSPAETMGLTAVMNADLTPMLYPKATPSYPSGHTAFAYVMAILLANMVPEKSVPIFDRAAEYGYNRVVAGAHFPTDVEAGRIAGTVIDSVFFHEPRFMTDFIRARAEVRQALKLPPVPGKL